MVNLWGPGAFGAARPSATRPSFLPVNGAGDPDDWMKDCSSSLARDGTEWRSAMVNALLAQLRALARKPGVAVSNLDDNLIAKAVRSFGMNYRAAGGSANALSLTLDPPVSDWSELLNVPLLIKASAANTATAVTLSVDGLAAVPVKRLGGGALNVGDIQPGCYYFVTWDGGQVQIVSTISLPAAITVNPLAYAGLAAYRTAGSYSWSVPAGVTLVRVTAVGGGGGGGGNSGAQGASGGCSGSVSVGRQAVTPGASIAVTVGGGGAGGAGGGGTGSTGGTSSFGSLQSSPGGPGGLASGNVNGGAAAGTGGEVNYPGGTPQVGGTTLFGGPGAWTPLGLGFGGNAGSGVQTGGGAGSGGSGAGPSTGLGGANGAPGMVTIEW